MSGLGFRDVDGSTDLDVTSPGCGSGYSLGYGLGYGLGCN